jgi:hypothetical protein
MLIEYGWLNPSPDSSMLLPSQMRYSEVDRTPSLLLVLLLVLQPQLMAIHPQVLHLVCDALSLLSRRCWQFFVLLLELDHLTRNFQIL